MIKKMIDKAKKRIDLSREEAGNVFEEIMSGKVETDEIASFLLALKEKKETVEEITGAAIIMRKFATKLQCDETGLLDTCGTGGDMSDTFNISTVSAFVASGAGCRVAKHGNKAVSSKCGSAEVLEGLGVDISAAKDIVERCIREIGIGFLFAPMFHLAMKHAIEARRAIKTRSIFNILGPLTNPALASYQLLGVYGEGLVQPLANVLKNLGSKRALVVHGRDGLDEITTTTGTAVSELKEGSIRSYELKPEDLGLKRARKEDLSGNDAACNARIATDILKGKKGPARDIVVLNAGAAIYVTGLASDIREGVKKAGESIDTGRALEKLEKLRKLTKT